MATLAQIQQRRQVDNDTNLALDVRQRYIEATKHLLSFEVKLCAKSWSGKQFIYRDDHNEFVEQRLDDFLVSLREPLDTVIIRVSCNGVTHDDYDERGLLKRYNCERHFSKELLAMRQPDYDEFLDYMVKTHVREMIMSMYDV